MASLPRPRRGISIFAMDTPPDTLCATCDDAKVVECDRDNPDCCAEDCDDCEGRNKNRKPCPQCTPEENRCVTY